MNNFNFYHKSGCAAVDIDFDSTIFPCDCGLSEQINNLKVESINKQIKSLGGSTNPISDGYHTFGELYEHRVRLFIALIKVINRFDFAEWGMDDIPVWKSKTQSDGTTLVNWFIAGIGTKEGRQITYHLPDKYYYALECPELEKAPKWDGHTSEDVLERLLNL